MTLHGRDQPLLPWLEYMILAVDLHHGVFRWWDYRSGHQPALASNWSSLISRATSAGWGAAAHQKPCAHPQRDAILRATAAPAG